MSRDGKGFEWLAPDDDDVSQSDSNVLQLDPDMALPEMDDIDDIDTRDCFEDISLWSVCFDQLFSYLAVKKRFERKAFKLKDSKTVAAITSTGDVEQYREATLAAHHQDMQYWAPATAKQQKMEHNCYSLQTECENVCFEQFPFIKRWLGDASAREFQRIDSIPPSKSGIAQWRGDATNQGTR